MKKSRIRHRDYSTHPKSQENLDRLNRTKYYKILTMEPQHHFCASRWVKLLAKSLDSLKEAEEKYRSESCVMCTDDNSHDTQPPSSPHSLSESRYFLYREADSSKTSQHDGNLSSALNAVKTLLREHPVLNRALGPSEDKEEFRIAIANSLSRISLIDIATRLINCGTESGFDDVASRLEELLSSREKHKLPCYHVSVFLGLRLNKEMQLSDGISIAPFERVKDFLDASGLENFVQNSKRFARAGSLGVVLKPSEWEPKIPAAGKELQSDIKWDNEFPKDAQTIVDLLAIAHGAPVKNIICFEFCVDRRVSELMGTHIGGGTFIRYTGLSINDDLESIFPSADKLSQVKDMFSWLKTRCNDLERYESVISRLSSSLLRKGRFAPHDKILDVAIALEQMYEIEGSGITYKLGTRASWFLEDNGPKRVEVFDKVKDFYGARSDVVHYRKKGKSKEWKTEQSDSGFDLASRTLFKLLGEGPPADWNKLVVSGGNK